MHKLDVLAHIHQFIQYVEDRMAAPKLFDKEVMKQKLEQIKEILDNAAPTEEYYRRTRQKVRTVLDRQDKSVARKRLKG